MAERTTTYDEVRAISREQPHVPLADIVEALTFGMARALVRHDAVDQRSVTFTTAAIAAENPDR